MIVVVKICQKIPKMKAPCGHNRDEGTLGTISTQRLYFDGI